jgi:hypothetical protein
MNNNKIFSKTDVLYLYNKDNLNQFMNKCLYSKYFVNAETYNKMFINQLLNPKTTMHMKYKEYLITMDVKEFIKKYYNMSNSFQKANLLAIINFELVKPSPNFLNMDSIYVIMQKNLKEKQFILNDYFKAIKKIKHDITTTTKNNYHFLNHYGDSFNNIFELKDSLINENSKQFNSRFYIDPQDKEDSIIFIENLIEYINDTTIQPRPKEQNEIFNNNNDNNNVERLVKITPSTRKSKKFKDKSKRIGAVSTLLKKLSSYENGYKGILRSNTHSKTISEKKGITPFEKECLEPKRKQSDVILMQRNSLFSSKLQRIILDSRNINKPLQINNSSNVTDRPLSKQKNSNQHFLSTKVFFGRLKQKQSRQMNQFIKQSLKTINVSPTTLTKSNTNASSLNRSNEFKTERSYEQYKNKVIPFSKCSHTLNYSTVTNYNNKHYKSKAFIQHCKTDRNNYKLKDISSNECSFNNEVIRSTIQQYYYQNVTPTQTISNKNNLTHRNFKSTLDNNRNSLYSSNNVHKINYTSQNSLNYFNTTSNLSSSVGINKDNKERYNSLNYCLSINKKRKIKNFALFLRKDIS